MHWCCRQHTVASRRLRGTSRSARPGVHITVGDGVVASADSQHGSPVGALGEGLDGFLVDATIVEFTATVGPGLPQRRLGPAGRGDTHSRAPSVAPRDSRWQPTPHPVLPADAPAAGPSQGPEDRRANRPRPGGLCRLHETAVSGTPAARLAAMAPLPAFPDVTGPPLDAIRQVCLLSATQQTCLFPIVSASDTRPAGPWRRIRPPHADDQRGDQA